MTNNLNDTNGLMLIKASAGSGKTFTLAKRYIEQLLFRSGSDGSLVLRRERGYHAHILAITFTNKATDEMKARIVKQLAILADPNAKSEYLDYFAQRCHPNELADIHTAAHNALTDILFDYDSFNVSTIDSFFQTVVRTFARELDRDYNYEVQIDTDLAITQAVHAFMLSLGRDQTNAGPQAQVEQWVKQFIRQNVSNNKSWNFYGPGNDLVTFAKNLTRELFHKSMDAIKTYLTTDGKTDLTRINKFRSELLAAHKRLDERFSGQHSRYMDLIQRFGIKDSDFHGKRMGERMTAPETFSPEGSIYFEETDRLLKLFQKEDYRSLFKSKFNYTAEIDAALRDFLAETLDLMAQRRLCQDLSERLGQIGLLGVIYRHLQDYCRDNNSLLIDDTNDLISTIINSGSQFIYERVGTWVNHFMIDEFQDTSRKQYENFRTLLHDSLSQGYFNMLIGDTKQSIYRFRNADPDVFRTEVEKDLGTSHRVYHDNLETNYRSLRAIVEFNNVLFKRLTETFGQYEKVRQTYDGLTANVDESKDKLGPGLVMLAYADPSLDELKDNDRVLGFLPRYLLWLHERHAWRDIGILVNTRREGNDVVQCILEYNKTDEGMAHPINVMSSESMRLSNSPAVRRIIGLLRFLDISQPDPVDEDDARAINDSAITSDQLTPNQRAVRVQLREQRLYAVLGKFIDAMKLRPDATPDEAGQLLKDCFDEIKPVAGLPVTKQLERYRTTLQAIMPNPRSEMVTLINITDLIIRQYLSGDRAGDNETAFVMTFQSVVANFCSQRNGGTVREFLRYWDSSPNLSVAATGDDAVQVMTIHKSKGLEFDCVVIPFANWEMDRNPHEHNYWIDKQQWTDAGLNSLFNDAGHPFDEGLLPPLMPVSKRLAAMLPGLKDFAHRQVEDLVVDNMDKTYVAFTRPKQELHVFFIKGTNTIADVITPQLVSDESLNMHRLTPDEVPCRGEVEQSADNAEVLWFSRGEVKPVTKHEKASDVERRVTPPYFVARDIVMPQVALQGDIVALGEQEKNKDLGRRLHSIMSHIVTAEDVDYAIRLSINSGLVTLDDSLPYSESRVRSIIERMVHHPQARQWFAPGLKVLNERSIIDVEGGRQVYRPDRIVIHPTTGAVVVVDYKFATPDASHHDQVRNYVDLLRREGYRQVEGFVFYGFEIRVESVHPA